MFSVYGVSGQTFRGTLENLNGVAGLSAARAARGIAREGEELGPEMTRPLADEHDSGPYRQAAEAYRRMLQVEPERGPIYHAYQIMTREVLTLHADDGVGHAWRQLSGRGIGQAPVLDARRRLVGMVSTANLLTVLNVEAGTLRDILARSVADVMITPVVSADPVTDVRRVARALLDYRLTGMPVVNDGDELVGIVSRSDILRVVVNEPPLSLWA